MSEADDDKPYPKPGEILDGKYEIQRVLGAGAMGAVVRATHKLRKAPVALKFMSPEVMDIPGVVDRFLNEGVAASQIDSEHVVRVLDVAKLPSGVPYLIMEYLEGEDLRELLEKEGKPGLSDIRRCVHFTLQLLRGLQVAHRAGIVHRDMKPANCFVVKKDGEPDFVKLVDFGISKVLEPEPDAVQLTNAGASLGTPLYMSPEQARNPRDVDARSDLYAVAVILYELLCGSPPFVPESGTLSELLIRLGTEDPATLVGVVPGVTEPFWEVIARGLEKNPKNRYQDAAAFAEALEPWADERSAHVLRQLLQRSNVGQSQFPPSPGPPTQVDPKVPFHAPSSTLMMSGDEQPPSWAPPPFNEATGPLADAQVRKAVEAKRAAKAEAKEQKKAKEPGDTAAVAQSGVTGDTTTQGTAKDAPTEPPRKGMSPLAIGIALGLLLGMGGIAVWAMSADGDKPTAPATASTTEATSEPMPSSSPSAEPTVEPVATAEPTVEPTAEPTTPVVKTGQAAITPPPSTAAPPPTTPPPASTKPTLGGITISD